MGVTAKSVSNHYVEVEFGRPVDASYDALHDAITYKLYRDGARAA